MKTVRQQARVAGLWYLAMAFIAPIGLMIVPNKLFVFGDAAATAERLRASAGLLRLAMASDLVHQAMEVWLVLALYQLFKGVDRHQARLLAVFGLLPIPIVFLNTLNHVAALQLAQGADFLGTFTRPQLDSLAYLFVRLHGRGVSIASVYWGLWLLPLAALVLRSGFIPKVFGWLLVAGGLGYLIASAHTLVFPQWPEWTDTLQTILQMGEVPIIFWLAIMGANGPKANEPLEA